MYLNEERRAILEADFLGWWTPIQLARFIGVRSQRIYAILDNEPGRIQGAYKHEGHWYLPIAPTIQRAERERSGPLLDYIEWQEEHIFSFGNTYNLEQEVTTA